jgi:uncharacterized protein YktB (UPF0637 family)
MTTKEEQEILDNYHSLPAAKKKSFLDKVKSMMPVSEEKVKEAVKRSGMVDQTKLALQRVGAPKSVQDKADEKLIVEMATETIEENGGLKRSALYEFMSHPEFKKFLEEFATLNSKIQKKIK